MVYRILINREECEVRVAFLEEDQLVELHTEKFDDQTIVNNIYRGRVQDVVPGLQAAFVDVGLERNMFLHFMDIRPESLVMGVDDPLEAIREASKTSMPGRIEKRGRRPRQDPNAPQAAPPVKRGDEIVVQVMKDEISGKAPRVTTNLSLAGRYLVMLPFPSQEGGVSRKIAIGQDRFRLKKLLAGLKTEDYSFIVRTAGLDQPEEAIRNDAETLEALWTKILSEYARIDGPGILNNDHDLIVRLVRDAFPPDFNEVICDDPNDAEAVRAELARLMPDKEKAVKVFQGDECLFEHFGVEKQIVASLDQKYWLKSGGSLIIDENEALTAIDVNTGRFTGKRDQEKTSLKTNTEACEAIARQIRLRDIGGIIVIDFIDMLSRSHQERVSEELRKQLKRDRAKTAIGRIGDFGLMVLTRKRQKMSLLNQVSKECPYCRGTGFVLRPDEVFRKLKYEVLRALKSETGVSGVVISAHPKLIDTLTSRYHRFFEKLKSESSIQIVYQADPDFHMEDFHITPMRRPSDDSLRLPEARIDDENLVRPAIIDYVTVIKEEKDEQIAKVEKEKLQAVQNEEEDEESDEEGRKKRRRRESSSERRARRRRARSRNGDDLDEEESGEPEAADEPEQEKEEDKEETGRRRTRRGTRGGRSRRKTAEDGQQAEATPARREPSKKPARAKSASSSTPQPTQPLTLKLPPKKSEESELLETFLNRIEEEVKTLKTEPEETKAAGDKTSKGPEKAEEKPAPKKTTRRRRTTKKAAEKVVKEAPEEPKPESAQTEEKPKKTTRRRTTRKPAAAKKAEPEVKEEKKTPTRRPRTKRTAETKEADKAPRERTASSTAQKTTASRKTTKKTDKPAAEKPAAKKTTTNRTAAKPKKTTTTRRTTRKKKETEKSEG